MTSLAITDKTDSVSEENLSNRVNMRRALRGERVREFCLHCRKKISEDRDRRAKYCGDKCRDTHRWSLIQDLLKEIRVTCREMKANKQCECGAAINQVIKQGPPAKYCKRCKNRRANATYNAKRRKKTA